MTFFHPYYTTNGWGVPPCCVLVSLQCLVALLFCDATHPSHKYPRSLSTSTTMITGPDQDRLHRGSSPPCLSISAVTHAEPPVSSDGAPQKANLCLLFHGYRSLVLVGCVGPNNQRLLTRKRHDATAPTPRRSEDHGWMGAFLFLIGRPAIS